MPRISRPRSMNGQTGGITIMVALSMLVFITITAMALSRNTFRDVVISGTVRQGAMARSVADSGLEWSIYWMDTRNAASANGNALKLSQLQYALLQNYSLFGKAWELTSATPASPSAYVPGSATAATLPAVTTPSGTTLTQSYSLGVTPMGKLNITDMSQGIGSGAFAPGSGAWNQQAPDFWAVRADAKVTTGGVSFVHAKEAWISTPIQ